MESRPIDKIELNQITEESRTDYNYLQTDGNDLKSNGNFERIIYKEQDLPSSPIK